MKLSSEELCLYAVTDRSWLGGRTLRQCVEEAIEGGVTFVQLREKELSYEAFLAEAFKIGELCKKRGVKFVINDNVEIAKKVGADGVHIGQGDMEIERARQLLGEDKIIGVTAKTVLQARLAESKGADYLGVGAVFGTSTKKDAKAISVAELKEIAESVHIPVVAIGGINESNLPLLKGTGIAGAAIVSGIFAKDDIKSAAANLKAIMESIRDQE